MRRLILSILLLAGSAFGADLPSCFNNGIILQGGTGAQNSNVIMQVRDSTTSSSQQYSGTQIWADDATHTSANIVRFRPSTPSVGNSVPFDLTALTFGTINPRDGQMHTYSATMNSISFGTINCPTGDNWPFTWNLAHAAPDFVYPLYKTAIVGTQTNLNTRLIFSTTDTAYSIGSSAS